MKKKTAKPKTKDAGGRVKQKVVTDSPEKKRKRADENDLDAMLARLDRETAASKGADGRPKQEEVD